MKLLSKILFLFALLVVSLNARTSERHASYTPMTPELVKQKASNKSFIEGTIEEDTSIKWKRRHKRRRKARRPRKGM